MDSTRSLDRVLAGALQGDRAVPAVGLVQELAYHLAHVKGVGGPLAALPLLLDPADDARVEAEPGAEGEPASGTPRPPCPGCRRRGRGRPCARCRSRSASSIAPVASTASFGRPRARAKTLVEPPGTTARRGRRSGSGPWCSRPLTTSLTVPSPPRATTSSMSSESAARRPRSRACPRYSVVDDLELHLAGQGVDQDVTGAGTGGGCCRIDHEKCAHGAAAYPARRARSTDAGPASDEAVARRLPCWGEQRRRPLTRPPARARPAAHRGRRAVRPGRPGARRVRRLHAGDVAARTAGQSSQAETGGVTLIALGPLPLIAARGLLARRSWSRGPGDDHPADGAAGGLDAAAQRRRRADPACGIVLAAVAVTGLVLLVNPTTTRRWASAGAGARDA